MKPARAILGSSSAAKRQLPAVKDDQHMQLGRLLLAVQHAPTSLERMLAVGRLCLIFLTDLMRRSNDSQDIPLLILGHHYMSHRILSDPKAPAAPVAAAPGTSSSAATAAAAAGAASAVATSQLRSYVQEICTFDAQEGPKSFAGLEGLPQAVFELALDPVAVAKSKRLGRDLSIKVTLQGTSNDSRANSVRALEWGEDYNISWPALLFLDPLSPACHLAFKGELSISCPQSGLFLSVSFAKDHTVKGVIEQTKAAAGATTGSPAASTEAETAAPGTAGLAPGRSSSGPLKMQAVGCIEGSWMSEVLVSCPGLGMEGSLYDSKAFAPAPVPSVDLRHLGPMRASRFWSVLHDALLYADPRAATGGRSAVKLANTLQHYLHALTLDSAAARDVGSRPLSTLGAPQLSSTAGGSSTAGVGASSVADSDLEEFDRQAEGLASGRLESADDPRDVPPCYKEQHAQGNKLKYMLHYTVTSLPGSVST